MSDKRKNAWSSASQIIPALVPFYREGTVRLAQESSAPNNWFRLNDIRSCEPRALTREDIGQRHPYGRLERQLELYDGLVEAGFARRSAGKRLDGDHYRLTGRGRELIEGFFQIAQTGIARAEALPAGEMAQLSDLLGRLVQASLESPATASKSVLKSSRWTDPGPGAEAIVLLDQYTTDLQRYHEDAHIAAWRSYGVSGPEWEAFTLLRRDEAATPNEIHEQRPNRGYTEEDYAAALQALAGRGWLVQDEGRYRVTAAGARIREEAESETERLFFESWSVLNEDELGRLGELAGRAVEALTVAGQPEYWSQARALSGAIYQVTRDVVEPLFEAEFDKPAAYFMTSLAVGSAPQPLTVEAYGKRFPYANPVRTANLLAETADAGYLQAAGSNGSNGSGDSAAGMDPAGMNASGMHAAFTVAEKGHEALERLTAPFYSYLDEIEVLSAGELEALAGLLERLVEASLEAGEPAGKWGIVNSHNGHPEGRFGPLALIDQYLDDLNAFRDDAHIAAWQPTGLDGRSWETFSFVWAGESNTAEALAERLPNRGYAPADYDASLTKLAGRGWIEEASGGYRVTEEGEALRREAETATNRLFFAPWSTLENAERLRLLNLLIRLKLSLQDLAEVGS
jgi:DNA-binding MarR family transcriptional regulator